MHPQRQALLLSWSAVGLGQAAFTTGTCSQGAWAQAAAVAVACVVAGGLHARLAPLDWRSSVAWPGLLAVVAVAPYANALPPQQRWLLVGVGLVLTVALAALTHGITRHVPRVSALLVATLGVVTARAAMLVNAPEVHQPGARLVGELTRPLGRLVALARPAATGPALVVVTVDTLRADHGVRMEAWARLARRGRSYPRAMATASWTVPSLGSLWTGLQPAEHGAGAPPSGHFSAVRDDADTAAERLHAAGYETAAFVSNPFVAPGLGFSRGFDTWSNPDDRVCQPLPGVARPGGGEGSDAQSVVERALRWLDDAPDQGFLLWVHLTDPHLPYSHTTHDVGHTLGSPHDVRDGRMDDTPAFRRAVADAYQGDVRYTDQQLVRLVDALDERGILADGVVLFTADHGEELWDHDGFEHGHSHHGEVIDVPLVVVGLGVSPGHYAGAPGDGVASLVDVGPTLLASAGLVEPLPNSTGRDLRAGVPADRVATAAGNLYGVPQRSARQGDRRVIVTPGGAGPSIARFDLGADPQEQRPLPPDPTDPLVQAAAAAAPATDWGRAGEVDLQALEALGYVER